MSISKAGRRRQSSRGRTTPRAIRSRELGATGFSLPPTISRAALLENGTDQQFRQLVYDLFTIAARMNSVREHLARRMGITGPQYSVLIAVAQLQGRRGVSVGALAKVLHVSSAFIATETGKLAQSGLITKHPNPKDRRGVLLNLTRASRSLIERSSPEIRAVNDLFFGSLSRSAFEAMSPATAALVRSSRKVMSQLNMMDEASEAVREAAE